ncbi:cyclic pyranopterin monophosphate synthase MoaC [candidate division TA06 bacterium]|uniref:Cyclic pyranopterin monophosphate synthase n=1 Tax=candidate division TA06 bacterium TaxID=2250710 RepID=A0A933IBU3_UNCT6|nr:cyclic pyranopterin monophosphate synthase MoaC [candidate division TA06 bacterium]
MQKAKGRIKNFKKLSHVNSKGRARMVDVTDKRKTERMARACGVVKMKPATLELIAKNKMAKGDVLGIARIAGIQAAKRTHELIPLCHPIALTHIEVDCRINKKSSSIEITSTVRCADRTGAEMEALTAVSAACLTVYDMAKAVDKGMVISGVKLVEKSGGKSGRWVR